ncbi:MAG: hypothetical protein L6R28_12510 [Planctomycetes bacterium]|nr:hypothetical protein [Planctomycetota bacterium]
MPFRTRTFLLALALGALAAGLFAEEGTQPPPSSGTGPSIPSGPQPATLEKTAPYYLIVDYLPAALYESDGLTACLRVENRTKAEAELEIAVAAYGDGDKARYTGKEKLRVAGGKFGDFQRDNETKDVQRIVFTLKQRGSDAALAAVTARLLRVGEAWPQTRVESGRLLDTEGAVLVPVTVRRLHETDRRWAPVRWALGMKEQDAATRPKHARLFLPASWGVSAPGTPPEKAQPAFGDLAPEGTPAGGLGPYALEGVAPVLRAAGDALRQIESLKEDAKGLRAVVVLPPEDLRAGTDPRLFRIALEMLLERLAQAGVAQTVLVGPVAFGVSRERHEVLWKEVQAIVQAHGARAVPAADFLDEKLWRVDPSTDGAYADRPNADGRKKIGQTLKDLLP